MIEIDELRGFRFTPPKWSAGIIVLIVIAVILVNSPEIKSICIDILLRLVK